MQTNTEEHIQGTGPLAAPPCSAFLDAADCCISLDEARDLIRRRERYADGLVKWVNKRRNAPDLTTLGMIQERMRPLCSKPNDLAQQRATNDEPETCEWPGCTNEPLCITGNAGGALVCRRHFKITNGKSADEVLPHELEAMQTMADAAHNREARVPPNAELRHGEKETHE